MLSLLPESGKPIVSTPIYPLKDNDLLYFLHIPKTAGTSFTDVLKANFKPDESSLSLPVNEFLKLTPEVRASFKAIAGHYFYNIQDFVPGSPVYITMFRDPIERTISIYTQARRLPNHYAYEIAKTQSLHEFVTDPRMHGLYVNCQTRYLSADPNTVELFKQLSPRERNTWALWGEMERYAPNGFADPVLLERAQERLQKFAFVGITEAFDEGIELLCHTFGWPIPPAPKILNVSPTRLTQDNIPPATLDIIRENTRLDAALYETAKEIFNMRYGEMPKKYPEGSRPEIQMNMTDVAEMRHQIEYQKRLIDSLQEDRAFLEEIIRAMQTSFGWRFVLRFNAARQKLIPKGSKREAAYKRVRDMIAGK